MSDAAVAVQCPLIGSRSSCGAGVFRWVFLAWIISVCLCVCVCVCVVCVCVCVPGHMCHLSNANWKMLLAFAESLI